MKMAETLMAVYTHTGNLANLIRYNINIENAKSMCF